MPARWGRLGIAGTPLLETEGQFGADSCHSTHPAVGGRCAMEGPAESDGQPLLDAGLLVRGDFVQNDVYRLVGGNTGRHGVQKGHRLLSASPGRHLV